MATEQKRESLAQAGTELAKGNLQASEEIVQAILPGASAAEHCEALFLLGVIETKKANYQNSINFFKEALAGAEKLQLKNIQGKILREMGWAYSSIGEYYLTLQYVEESLRINQELGDEAEISKSYDYLALACWHLSDFSRSLEYLQKALSLDEKNNNKARMATITENIGVVLSELGDNERGLEYLKKSVAVSIENGNKSQMATRLSNLAALYENLDDSANALDCGIRSLELCREVGHKRQEPITLKNIGSTYLKLGDYTRALQYYTESLDLDNAAGNKAGIAQGEGGIARVYARQSFEGYNPLKAEEHFVKAIALCKEIGDKKQEYKLCEELSFVYEHLERWKDFAVQIKRYHQLKELVQSEDARKGAQLIDYRIKETEREKLMAVERARAEEHKKLLDNILPSTITERIIAGEKLIADRLENVSVLFADIVEFTRLSSNTPADTLINTLNVLFSEFDSLAEKHGLEKIKTIGDAYMIVAGAPTSRTDHAIAITQMAAEMLDVISKYKNILPKGELKIRIGIHSGEVVAGVIGTKKFAYDIWGDTVNTAARMEQNSEAGRINISESTYQLVRDTFNCEYRGEIEAKNKGKLKMYFLE